MASRFLGASIPEWVWKRTIEPYQPGNLSQHVAELLVLGAEAKEKEIAEKNKKASEKAGVMPAEFGLVIVSRAFSEFTA